jgi:aspartate/methionine/tyrosine aminotransferase
VWTHPGLRNRTLASHSFSKSHALPFVRLCFTVVPPEELDLALAAMGKMLRPKR